MDNQTLQIGEEVEVYNHVIHGGASPYNGLKGIVKESSEQWTSLEVSEVPKSLGYIHRKTNFSFPTRNLRKPYTEDDPTLDMSDPYLQFDEEDGLIKYQKGEGGAIKYSGDKMKWRTLPLFLIRSVAKIFDYGCKKYKLHNWMGLTHDDLLDTVLRHLEQHQQAIFELWKHGWLEKENNSIPREVSKVMDHDRGMLSKLPIIDRMYPAYFELFDMGEGGSGLPHIDHAIAGLIMYRHQLVNGQIELPEESRL